MTMSQAGHAVRPARSQPTAAPVTDLEARVRLEGRRAHLDDILRGLIVNALGPDGRVAVAGEDWSRFEEAIREPIEAIAASALGQLAAEVEAAVTGRMPELGRRLAEHRLRAELGYD